MPVHSCNRGGGSAFNRSHARTPTLDRCRPVYPPTRDSALAFLLETIRLGLTNLRLHALRSILTAIGIILGVAAVITMIAIGEGSKQSALAQIERLGARNIIIRSIKPPESNNQGGGGRRTFLAKFGITRDDLEVVRQAFPEAASIVPLKSIGSQVFKGALRKQSQGFGTTPDLERVARLTVARGRYLSWGDMNEQAAVAILGHDIARTLFPFDDPLGSTVRIDEQAFVVVGVLAPVGTSGGAGAALVGRDFNLDIHVPLTTAQTRFGDAVVRVSSGSRSSEEVQVREIIYEAPTRERVLVDAALIKRVFQVRHPKLDDIQFVIPYQLLEDARSAALRWQLVLAAIAAISLVVGGVGIMNIMLASVTERTREIGIRRALGATRKHIVWQFLVETSVLSAVGGVIGVLAGISLSFAIGWGAKKLFAGADMTTSIPLWSVVVSFVAATLTGLVAGIYPARQAARQDPIVALRHD